MADSGFALFQSRLLELLWEEDDPAAIKAALLADDDFAAFHDYVRGMEPRMIAVAGALVRKWGRAR